MCQRVVCIFVLALLLDACSNPKNERNEAVRKAERDCGLAEGSLGVDPRESVDGTVWIIGFRQNHWAPCVTAALSRSGYKALLGDFKNPYADKLRVE